jgi:hypothetical protein
LFLSRRVLPLQRRAHKMSQMSGLRDPTRITTHSLSPTDLVLKAKQICQTGMRADGKFGLKPYSRSDPPPPRVRSRDFREASSGMFVNLCSDLVSCYVAEFCPDRQGGAALFRPQAQVSR